MPVLGKATGASAPVALSTPDHVVLGMVRLGARSGYEIKQAVELSIRFFWTISPAQIYPSLERLERGGFVRGRSEPQGRRPRRVYVITATGEAALDAWLRREEPMPFELRDLGMLKLFFSDGLDPADARRLLADVRRRSQERSETLRGIEGAAREVEAEGNIYPHLTLALGIACHEAMVDVCDAFAARL